MILIVLLLLVTSAFSADYRVPAGVRTANTSSAETVLPGGRLLTSTGQYFFTGPGTFGLALSPDGLTIASADGGPNSYSLTLLHSVEGSWQRRQLKARQKNDPDDDPDDWRSVFMGLAFDGENELYAAEGNSGRIRLVDTRTGRKLRSFDLNTGGFKDSYTGDLALDRRRGLLYVVDQANFRVVTIDVRKHKVLASVRVGRLPFAITLSPDSKRAYVTNIGMFEYKALPGADPKQPIETGLSFPAFGFPSAEARKGVKRETERGLIDVPGLGDPNVAESNSLCVLDVGNPEKPTVVKFIPTGLPFGKASLSGSSPSGVTATADKIFVSNTGNDSISVIDARALKVDGNIPIRIPGLERFRGVMPIGLALHQRNGWLLVAEAGINAIGVIDIPTGRVLGHIPAGWFPTRVLTERDIVYAANAKGFGTGPNAGVEKSFQADMRRGIISMFLLPKTAELDALTDHVYRNNGFTEPGKTAPPLPQQIENVVIIVKENRTYDDVFSDGARYGSAVTPNHHEMANRWAKSDNFYADSEVSVDGHHWLVGSYPNAWTESSLMAAYGGAKDFRMPTTAPGRLSYAGSNSSVHPEDQSEGGTLWHHLERNKISFRNFGEGYELAGIDEGEGLKPTGARILTNVPMPDPLYRNTSRNYAQFNMNIPDQHRANQLIGELSGFAKLPRLLFIHLPNDHSTKPRPADGYPTAASYIADNDIALGRIMEFFSKRPEWKHMTVFVTEDDAQGGVDRVDSHRTVLLIAGPYVKKGYVSHQNSSFPGLLKTAFRLLRIPPLNLYDAAAADLSDAFTDEPDFSGYELKPVSKEIFDPAKAREPKDPKPSVKMDDPTVLRRQQRN
jgi:YVTN family beta-propeller protein